MEVLGIGPSELFFIILLALILLGPKDMQKAGRTIGKFLRQIVTSDGWKVFQQTSREIQTLPNRLMREAALDELKELQQDLKQPLDPNRRLSAPALPGTPLPLQPGVPAPDPNAGQQNSILPPANTPPESKAPGGTKPPAPPSSSTADEDSSA
jgi:sec-independent protein translocase protein TatB